MKRVHILTGATGYLGSHLAFELLRAHPQDSIICLASGPTQESADDCIRRAVRIAARTSAAMLSFAEQARMRCMSLDVLQKEPGTKGLIATLDDAPLARRVFWQLTPAHNNNTVVQELELARALRVNEFNHLSGTDDTGLFATEQLLRHACESAGVPLRIFRPSVLVGHSVTHLSSCGTGIYHLAERLLDFWEVLQAQEPHREAPTPMKVKLTSDTSFNLIPVDICAREMLAIASTEASLGRLFRITSKDSFRAVHFYESLSALTGMPVTVHDPHDNTVTWSQQDDELARCISQNAPCASTDLPGARDSVLAFCDVDLQTHLRMDQHTMQAWLAHYINERRIHRMVSADARLFAAQAGLGSEFNIAGWLLAEIRAHGRTSIALHSEQESLSYGELAERVRAVALVLTAQGVMLGTRVSLMAVDSTSSVLAMLGAMYVGAVVIQINPMAQATHVLGMLKQANTGLLIADAELAAVFDGQAFGGETLALDALMVATKGIAPNDCEAAYVSAHAPAFGVFTSGSTGSPKLVLHAHMDFRVATDRYASQLLDVKSSDTVFSASRLSFAFGLQNLFIALSHGAAAVLAPRSISAETISRTLTRYAPSVIFAVPTIYQMILNRVGDDEPSYKHALRVCIAAGESLPEEIGRRWQEKFGLPILDSLGSSEVFSTYLSNIYGVSRPGATGKLVPGFDAMLTHDSGQPCKTGESGVLWIRGPSVIPAYADAPTAPQTLFRDGWFCTKDVFWRDADGYFYYRGRLSEMFKVAGQWISPTEIESVLLRHPRVQEAAVTTHDDESATTRPSAFIVASPGPMDGLEDDIKQFCKRELESWKYPHFVQFVSALPRTLTGKLRRYALTTPPAPDAATAQH